VLENMRLGFIGAGNMATALIRGMLAARLATPQRILIFDIDANKIEKLVAGHGVAAAANNLDLVRRCDLVVLAVKPQVMNRVLAEIAPAVRNDQCFLSIAAGVTLSRLEGALGPRARVIRVMPNTPALIGAGAAGIARGRIATDDDVALARAIFEAVGIAVVLDERRLDAVTAVSGSGPAYLFFFVEALLDAAGRVGLESDVAQALVKQTVLGAARMVVETSQPPAQLREAVTSPGGTTAAALAVLRDGGFTDLIGRAVQAATARSIELGKS
jgi:pyrroline-5-carboxylate reductase